MKNTEKTTDESLDGIVFAMPEDLLQSSEATIQYLNIESNAETNS